MVREVEVPAQRAPSYISVHQLLSGDLDMTIPFLCAQVGRMCQSRAGIRAWDGSSCGPWLSLEPGQRAKEGPSKVALGPHPRASWVTWSFSSAASGGLASVLAARPEKGLSPRLVFPSLGDHGQVI